MRAPNYEFGGCEFESHPEHKDLFNAQMVKLVDTLVSGTSGRKAVQVRVLFWAQVLNQKSEIRN